MKTFCAIVLGLVALVAADIAPPHQAVPGYGVVHPGFGHYGGFPYGGIGVNDEHHYRAHPGYPVHVGNGNFYYLGIFPGHCANRFSYGFYYAGDNSSFIVCDHGRAHRFQCPTGTQNSDITQFAYGSPYSMAALCGQHTN